MRYISTRGQSPAQGFCDILLGGLAPDGGLYLPESYPQITRAELDAWRGLSYADLAFEILSKFITDIPAADLKAICQKTYTPQVYCYTREGSNAKELGKLLFTQYLVQLEVAAAILLVAMIAAIALTLRARKDSKYVSPGDQVRVRSADRMTVVKMDATKAAVAPVVEDLEPKA